jgi:hypothetical protein
LTNSPLDPLKQLIGEHAVTGLARLAFLERAAPSPISLMRRSFIYGSYDASRELTGVIFAKVFHHFEDCPSWKPNGNINFAHAFDLDNSVHTVFVGTAF